jgi:hypothetical protein
MVKYLNSEVKQQQLDWRNIVEDASVTLSLKIYFVNVVGCS